MTSMKRWRPSRKFNGSTARNVARSSKSGSVRIAWLKTISRPMLKSSTPVHPTEEVIQVNDRFYILATSPRVDEQTRVLKQGDTFAVFDRYGDIQPAGLGE